MIAPVQNPDERSSSQFIYSIKKNTEAGILFTANRFVCTRIGQWTLSGLDRLVNMSETVLNLVSPKTNTTVEYKPQRIEIVETKEISSTSDKEQEPEVGNEKETDIEYHGFNECHDMMIQKEQKGIFKAIFRGIVVFPTYMVFASLNFVSRYLHRAAKIEKRNSMTPPLSPDKIAEINGRLKISPRKRMKSDSATSRFLHRIFGIIRTTSPRNMMKTHGDWKNVPVPSELNQDKAEVHKRKYDDVTDSDNDIDLSEDEGFDLENYKSDEDPDYMPSADPKDETLDIHSESEVEDDTEEIDTSNIVQGKRRKPKLNQVVSLDPNLKAQERAKIPLPASPAPSSFNSSIEIIDPPNKTSISASEKTSSFTKNDLSAIEAPISMNILGEVRLNTKLKGDTGVEKPKKSVKVMGEKNTQIHVLKPAKGIKDNRHEDYNQQVQSTDKENLTH